HGREAAQHLRRVAAGQRLPHRRLAEPAPPAPPHGTASPVDAASMGAARRGPPRARSGACEGSPLVASATRRPAARGPARAGGAWGGVGGGGRAFFRAGGAGFSCSWVGWTEEGASSRIRPRGSASRARAIGGRCR